MTTKLAVIDMAPLFQPIVADRLAVAEAIGAAAERDGFFYVSGHGVGSDTVARLQSEALAFFALPETEKAQISMAHGGSAWRGWFPLNGELTSGQPDRKEGIYFGEELSENDPRVRAGWPMHGANLWPTRPTAFRQVVENYIAETGRAASALMQGVSLALGLTDNYFAETYLRRPTLLFRIFRYPPAEIGSWGVGEHTDYGLLTLLAQDQCGGLQVRTDSGWIEAPPIADTLVCNVGDMLERLSGGQFVSAPHRVLNRSGQDRFSFPLFFDPDFEAVMTPAVEPVGLDHRNRTRWDQADPKTFAGRYGDYLLGKVGKVFPELKTSTFLASARY
jgi:isopenicillin N synthase-like dioxygenase